MTNVQHPIGTRKSSAPTDPSPMVVPPETIKVPAPVLIDYLIDHLLVEHILIEWPVDIRPERIFELMADHLADLPLECDIPIPVEQVLDHLLEHLFEIEVAVEEAEEREAGL